MSKLEISLTPPKQWDMICQQHNALFHSRVWQSLVNNSLNSHTIYAWTNNGEIALAITAFKAGPFRVGYIGFPAGGLAINSPLDAELIDRLIECLPKRYLHILRIPCSAFTQYTPINAPYKFYPETAITDLQNWDHSRLPNIRRDIRKASRSGLVIHDAIAGEHANIVFGLYYKTITQHRGGLRYNKRYFEELIKLSEIRPHLRCLIAKHGSEIAGFLIIALHHQTAYYLHGAIDRSLKHLCPSDLLLSEAINWAKQQKMRCFNMMTSPPSQPSLVRYKEKWGANTRQHCIFEIMLDPLYGRLFTAGAAIYDHLFYLLPRRS